MAVDAAIGSAFGQRLPAGWFEAISSSPDEGQFLQEYHRAMTRPGNGRQDE